MSSSKIDRSLEDIIKESKAARKKGKPGRKTIPRGRKAITKGRKGRTIGQRRPKTITRERPGQRQKMKRFSRPIKHQKERPRSSHKEERRRHRPKPKEEKGSDPTKLHVGNLPPTVANSDLQVGLCNFCYRPYERKIGAVRPYRAS